jgi:hypothetical protein
MTSFIVPAGAAKEAAFDDELLPPAAAAYLARFKGLSRSTPTPTFGHSSAGAPNETSNHSKPNPPSSSCAYTTLVDGSRLERAIVART